MISLENLFENDGFTLKNDENSVNSTEKLMNKQSSDGKIEQDSIKSVYSLEADDDGEDFESSVGDDAGGDNPGSEASGDADNEDTDFGGSEDMPSFDDSESGDDMGDSDDFGGDSGDGGDGGDDDSSSGSGNSEDNTGMDDIDKSSGSSLNPFTQINQKMYLMDQMNLLYTSISNAIQKYTINYSETVELQQLHELLDIVGDERDSFIMQENPENMIKLELYMKQYEIIIRNLTSKIKEYD